MRSFRALLRNRDGGIAVPCAFVLMTLIGVGAFSVDVGSFFFERRKLQTAADLASIAAASDLTQSLAAATATLRMNNLDPSVLIALEQGRYSADAAIPSTARYTTSNGSPTNNAVRVTLERSVPTYLGRALTGEDRVQIRTQATAARTSLAAFSIGSRLVEVNAGLLNGMLSRLLGTEVSLSVMDYEALLAGQIDLLAFSTALAGRVSFTGVSYDNLLATSQRIPAILGAMADASGASPAVARVLDGLSRSAASVTDTVALTKLASFGPYGGLALGAQVGSALNIGVSAFDLLAALAQAANGSRQVELSLTSGLPAGLASAKLRLAMGERPVGTSWITLGHEGATVTTAQTRVLLTVQLLNTGPFSLLTVPIYLELAGGSATLKSMTCGSRNIANARVVLSVKPSILDSWIGDVSTADFYSLGRAPNPTPATISSVPPLYSIAARSRIAISNLSGTDVPFSYAEIQARTKKSTNTTDFLSSLISNLLGKTTLEVQALGFGVTIPNSLTSPVATALSNAARPVDRLLSGILSSLGVGLGQAETWVTGLRCDGAVLVH